MAELIQGGRVKLMVALEAILLNHDRRDIERREDDRVLGSIIQVPKFAIGVATLAVFFVLALTVTFYRGSKETRDTLTFFVLAGALAGGGVGAFYVWAGVKTAIRQRQQTATENRIQFALQFLTRWNDPGHA